MTHDGSSAKEEPHAFFSFFLDSEGYDFGKKTKTKRRLKACMYPYVHSKKKYTSYIYIEKLDKEI